MRPFRPWLTFFLIAVLGGIYVVEHLVGAIDQRFLLVRLGASVPALVAAGQWERLVTAGFLHAFREHYLVNGISLLSMGALIERELGRARFLAIYLGSSIGGAWTSAVMNRGPLSVGASAAIFGLLGAFALMHLKYGDELPYGVRQSRRWWAIILLINGGLSVLVPQIDGLAHAGGFVFGAAVGLLVLPRTPNMESSRWSTLVATALTLVTVIGLVRSAQRALSGQWEDDVFAAQAAFASHPSAGPLELNDFAWLIAIDPKAPRRSLELALTAAERAVELSGRHPGVLDTLAECQHRLGRDADAVRTESEALALEGTAVFATQLGRFIAARDNAGDPTASSFPSSRPASAPSSGPAPLVVLADKSLVLNAPGPCAQAFLRAEYQGRHAWLIHVSIDRTGLASDTVPLPADIAARFSPETKVFVSDVSSACATEQTTETLRFTYWPRDPEVDPWP